MSFEPKRDSRSARGRSAEDLALTLLERRGYTLVDRNWRGGRGELDLICKAGALLVFVEVRSRRGEGFGHALESVNPLKLYRLRSAGRAWLAAHGMRAQACRFDLAALQLTPDGRVESFDVVEGIIE